MLTSDEGKGVTLRSNISDRSARLDSVEVDLLTRNGSVADSIVNGIFTIPNKSRSVKIQGLVTLTCNAPPLKGEDGAGRPPRTIACSCNTEVTPCTTFLLTTKQYHA